jgi:DNA-binding winged helix-turn-helix (wHTH) protein/Tfp pilus assembly protein PilF
VQNDPSPASGRIRFDDFEVDVESHELFRLGRRLRLQEKSFVVLSELLRKPGQVVTREELAAALWPKEYFVDAEHGLNTAVRRLREALGDSAEDPRYVETLPKLGYRFVGAIENASGSEGKKAALAPSPPPALPSTTAPVVAQGPAPAPVRHGAIAAGAILVAVVLTVIAAMVVRSRSSAPAGAAPPASTGNAIVEELLERARYLRNHKRLDESKRFVEEALRIEPTNPEALACRAMAYLVDDEVDRARETARRALEIDPKAWEAHRVEGNLARRAGDFTGAERHFRLAVESNPADFKARNRYARHLLEVGRVEEAKPQIVETKRLAPDDPDVQNIWIQYALITGDYETAIRQGEIWLSIWDKQYADSSIKAVRTMLAWAYVGARRREEAIAQFRAVDPEDDVAVALALGHSGDIAEARRILDARRTAAAADSATDPGLVEGIAKACTVIGDLDCAFEFLDRQIAARLHPAWLHYPLFRSIRTDARWPSLAERIEREFFRGKEAPVPPDYPEGFIHWKKAKTIVSGS